MKKVKCVFVVDRFVNMATRVVNNECQWVLDGEGLATVKFDGTSCFIQNDILYKRWNRTLLKQVAAKMRRNPSLSIDESMFKPVPDGAIACESSFDKKTLHWPYWVPVLNTPADAKHNEAFLKKHDWQDGTYELIGPGIQGNKHGLLSCELHKHGDVLLQIERLDFDGLSDFMRSLPYEGVVWHHPDGRMAKLRRSHFNFAWGDPDPRDDQEARARFVP